MKRSKQTILILLILLLAGCTRTIRTPGQSFGDLKRGLEIAEASIISAGFVIGELVESGDVSEEKSAELFDYGNKVLTGIQLALFAAEEAESVEAGQRQLLEGISTVVEAIGEALREFDLPDRVRVGLIATQAGLTLVQALR